MQDLAINYNYHELAWTMLVNKYTSMTPLIERRSS